jgi:Type II secretion system (T2SS), protein E, N-terminal domain
LPVVDPRAAEVPRAALDAVPHSVARRQLLVPVDLSGPVLTVASVTIPHHRCATRSRA